MDDGYLIHESKDHLRQCLSGMRRICEELGITLNEKKTQIVKLSHGFTFLKAKIYLTPAGKVIKKIPRMSVTRQRRKLKKLAGLTDIGRSNMRMLLLPSSHGGRTRKTLMHIAQYNA